MIARMQEGVRQVRRLTGKKGDRIAKGTVGEINRISSKLIVLIYGGT
jgi:hypothetical protein